MIPLVQITGAFILTTLLLIMVICLSIVIYCDLLYINFLFREIIFLLLNYFFSKLFLDFHHSIQQVLIKFLIFHIVVYWRHIKLDLVIGFNGVISSWIKRNVDSHCEITFDFN